MRKETFYTVLNTILTMILVWVAVEWFLITFCYQKGWLLQWIITNVK